MNIYKHNTSLSLSFIKKSRSRHIKTVVTGYFIQIASHHSYVCGCLLSHSCPPGFIWTIKARQCICLSWIPQQEYKQPHPIFSISLTIVHLSVSQWHMSPVEKYPLQSMSHTMKLVSMSAVRATVKQVKLLKCDSSITGEKRQQG